MGIQYPAFVEQYKSVYDQKFDEFVSAFSELRSCFPVLKKTRDNLNEQCCRNVEVSDVEQAKLDHDNALHHYREVSARIECCQSALIEARSELEQELVRYKIVNHTIYTDW